MKFEARPAENVEPLTEKLPDSVRKKAITYALLIAGGLGVGGYAYDRQYGGKDYTEAGTFNQAFRKARVDQQRAFWWQGRRFSTELVDPEFSENYQESKKFLEAYYASEYFKTKQRPGDFALSQIRFNFVDAASDKLTELFDKQQSSTLTEEEREEMENCRRILSDWESLESDQEYQKRIKDSQEGASRDRITRLNERTYFSITTQKGNMKEDGFYDPKSNKVYIYRKEAKEGGKNDETTAVHELTHKSSHGLKAFFETDKFYEITDKAYESAKKNPSFLSKYGKEDFKYLSNPSEIDARQNSVRFYLYKHFPGYAPDTVFSSEHYNFLQQHYKELPYDIRQLIDLFPNTNEFISNMNTY